MSSHTAGRAVGRDLAFRSMAVPTNRSSRSDRGAPPRSRQHNEPSPSLQWHCWAMQVASELDTRAEETWAKGAAREADIQRSSKSLGLSADTCNDLQQVQSRPTDERWARSRRLHAAMRRMHRMAKATHIPKTRQRRSIHDGRLRPIERLARNWENREDHPQHEARDEVEKRLPRQHPRTTMRWAGHCAILTSTKTIASNSVTQIEVLQRYPATEGGKRWNTTRQRMPSV